MKVLSLKTYAVILFTSISSFGYFSQIAVTPNLTALQLAEIFAGSNLTVSNATLTGSSAAVGSFTSSSGFAYNSGIVLCTGNAVNAAGPNNDPNTGDNLSQAGNPLLEALGGAASRDAVVLEFDFVVQSASVQFNYIFASEEYPEFAPPNQPDFTDVFAFYISGPGITGEENIALIPGTTQSINIQNVNAVTNQQYYVDNTGGQAIQFDGYTTDLAAIKEGLIPCQTYHLKLMISDIRTSVRNSAVFFEENSFVQDGGNLIVDSQTIQADNTAREGCTRGSFTFSIPAPEVVDRIISFTIGGTAVNGVDYQHIDNNLIIPAGDTSVTLYIDAFSDGVPEGQETITLDFSTGGCGGSGSASMFIDDAQPIQFTLDHNDLTCFENNTGEIIVNASGGFPPYNFTYINSGGTMNTVTSSPITGLSADQYTVRITDAYGCKAEALVVGGIFDADTTFLPDGTGVPVFNTLTISGFGASDLITNVNQIQQVCLSLEHSYMGDIDITLIAPNGQEIILKNAGGGSTDLGEPVASGPVDGAMSSDPTPGNGYEYCFNATPTFGTMNSESGNFFRNNYTDNVGNIYSDNYLPAGSYTPDQSFNGLIGSPLNGDWSIRVFDNAGLDNGYIFNWYISLIGDLPDSTVTILQPNEIVINGLSQDATCGTANGAINTSIINGAQPLTIAWSNGANTEDISSLNAGSYIITVTDNNTCSATKTFNVNNSSSIGITTTVTPVSCYNGNDGTINATITGGQAPYSISWSNGSNNEDISSLSPGTYTITVTDQQGCIKLVDVIVPNASLISISTSSIQNEVCNTDNGAISLNVTGGSGVYSYLWNTNSTTQNQTNLSAGSYSVTVTDNLNCSASQSFSIINDLSNCSSFCFLDVQENAVANETCGNVGGSIDVNILNALNPVTISWSNGANTEDILGLAAGTYTITVADGNACTSTKSFTVGNNTGNLGIAQVIVSDELCSNNQGAINITVSGGLAPYTFAWSNGSGTEDLSAISTGTYSVTITDANGCAFTADYTVLNNAGTLAVSGTTGFSFCNSNNGSITQTVTGANGSVSYLWESGAITQNRSNLASGIYTCIISDQLGCSTTADYTVTESTGDIQLLGINTTSEQCGNSQGSINLTTAGTGLTYLWSNGAVSEDISALSAGNYSCTITNDQGCNLSSGTIYVGNSNGGILVSTISNTAEICNQTNGSLDISVIGGTAPYTYSWSNGAASEDLTNLSDGVYTVNITDANNCVKSQSFTINDNSGTLAIDNAILSNNVCGTTTAGIDLTISGGTTPYAISWSNGELTEDILNLTGGTYTVTITDASNCVVNQSYEIQSTYLVNAGITNENCGQGNGAINLSLVGGTAPFTFNWSNGANTEDISNLSIGTYSVSITDNNGCNVNQSFDILNQVGSLAVSGSVTDENCGQGNGAISVTVTGGNNPLSFMWNNGTQTEDLSNVSAGNYSLMVTDLFGCSVSYSATVANLTNGLSLSLNGKLDENCGQANGAIDITTTGSGIISYVWSNGALTEDITNIGAGTYTLTATDDLGCSTSISEAIVNQTGSLAVTFTNTQSPLCGINNGFIDIEVSGTNPISYDWSNGQNTQDIVALSANTYTVELTDGNGCVLTQSFDLNSASTPITSTAIVTDADCGQTNGQINLTVTSGIAPYSFDWSNGTQLEDPTNLAAGNYSVVITDAFGCSSSSNFTVVALNNANVQINQIFRQDDFCSQGQGQIFVDAFGVQNYYINGVQDFNFGNFFGLSAGTYTIGLEDFGGCRLDTNIVIGNQANFTLAQVVTDETCGANNGAVNLTPDDTFNQGLFFNFSWSNGANTEDLSNLSAGTYTVIVTDNFGCSLSSTAIVNNQTGTFAISNTSVTQSNCGTASGAIDLTIIGGTSPYTISWSNGANTEDISSLLPGTYDVTITDASNCSLNASYTINNSFQVTGVVTDASCNQANGAINISTTGGSGPYTFDWSNGSVNEDLINILAGTYDVTVTDNNACSTTASFIVSEQSGIQLFSIQSFADFCSQGQGQIFVNANNVQNFYINGVQDFNFGNFFGLTAGTYLITLEDFNGCTLDTNITVGNQANFTITQVVTDETCGANNGAVNITPNDIFGQGLFFNYSWSNGQVTQDISNLAAGTYTVTVTDNFGCSLSSTAIVNNQTGTFAISNASITQSNCGTASGAIDLTIVGGTSPYTISWSNGANTEDLSSLLPGTYDVTITDATNCSLNALYIINNTFQVTGVVTNASCSQSNGAINISMSGGSSPYTFDWSNGSTNEDLNNISAGTYDVTVTDNNACSTTASFIVDELVSFDIQFINIQPDFCGTGQGSIDIVTNGPVNEFYIDGVPNFGSGSFFNLTGGSYTITIEDVNGCTLDTGITIQNQMTFTPSFVVTDETCGANNGAIDMSVTDDFATGVPFTYLWSTNATTEDLSNLAGNTYTVEITHDLTSLGFVVCVNTYDVVVNNQTGSFQITNAVVTPSNCTGATGAIDITIAGGTTPYTILWSNGANTEDLSNLAPGTYSVSITDASACELNATYTIQSSFQASGVVVNASCNQANGSINLSTSGGTNPITYAWSNGANTEDISGLGAGTYDVTITDNAGCTLNQSFVVNENAGINIQFIDIQPDFCGTGQGSIDIITNGPVNEFYIDGVPNFGSGSFFNLTGGSYTITIEDVNGCTLDTAITIQNQMTFTPTFVVTDETCGANNGAIDMSVTDDFATGVPFTYLWSTGSTNEDLASLAGNTYTVEITHDLTSLGFVVCVNTYDVIVNNQTGSFQITNAVVTPSNCTGATGAINITIAGGTAPYTILWSNGANTEDLSNLAPGTYSVSITDASACELNATYIIQSSFQASGVVVNASCNQANGSINLSTSGGTNPITYAWSNGANTEDISGLGAGTYDVTITDNAGCTLNQSFVVNENAGINIQNIQINQDICGAGFGQITVQATGVQNFYIDGVEDFNFGDFQNVVTGNHTITLENASGCLIDTIIFVPNGMSFTPTFVVTDETCGANNGSIDMSVTDDFATGVPFTYLWSTGSTNEDLANLAGNTYTVEITHDLTSLGFVVCVNTYDVVVNNQTGSFQITNAVVTPSNCTGATGAINITIAGGTAPYTILWSNGANTEDLSNLAPGTYSVSITDASACELNATYIIQSSFQASGVVVNASCNQANGSINLTTSGGTNPITYTWSNGANTEDISGLGAGTYDVTITDNAGCTLNQSFVVNENAGIQIQNIQVNQDICGAGFGQITVQATGVQNFYIDGVEDFNFGDFQNVVTGNHTITLENASGCLIDTIIFVPNGMSFTPTFVVTDEFCGSNNGAIDMTVTDDFGTGVPFTYLWSSNATTEDINGLNQGTYTVEITHDLTSVGFVVCVNTYDVVVNNQAGAFNISNVTITDESCGLANGAIDITVNGGVAPITFAWSNGQATEDISGLSGGDYTINLTDNTGCTFSNTYTVGQASAIAFQSIVLQNDNCNTGSGSITVQTTGNVTELKLNNVVQFSNVFTNLSQGTYTLSISNGLGCNIDSVVTIQSTAAFDASAIIVNETCVNNNGSIDVTIDSLGLTNLALTYQWSNGSTIQDVSNVSQGTHSLTITNSDGCAITRDFVVDSLFTIFTLPTFVVTEANCFNCADGKIDMTVPTVIGQTYNWNTDIVGEEDLTNVLTGVYNLTITNDLGCDTIIQVSVGYKPNSEIIFTLSPNPAKDYFQVTISFPNGEKGKLVMYDYIGQIVYESPELTSGVVTFDTYEFSAAAYFLAAKSSSVFERLKFQIIK